MGAPTQKGTAVKIGFATFAITGYIPEDGLRWRKTMQEERIIKDVNALTMTKILADPADIFEMDLIILDASGSITPVQKGATVAITTPGNTALNCMCVDDQVTFERLGDKKTLSLIKEDSMTYTA